MVANRSWSKADPNISMLLAAHAGIPSLAVGPPGVAKSSIIHSWSKAANRELMLLIGSTHAPEDFSGLPYISECKSFFRQTPPFWADRLSRPGAALFLDELTTVPPSVRAAMLSLLTERRLGDLVIHPDTLVFAACNPASLAPNASPLEKSMSNRFFHWDWVHDKETWDVGMMSEDDDFRVGWCPVIGPVSDWKRFRPHFGGIIVSYTQKNSNERIHVPTADDEFAFATPRTWKYLRDALCVAESVGAPDKYKRELAVGLVGKQIGRNFIQFYSTRDLVDPEAILAGIAQFRHDQKRCDLTVTLLTSIVTCIKQRYTEERMDAAVDFFCRNVGQSTADLVFCQLRHLINARPEGTRLSKNALAAISEFGDRIPPELRRKKAG